MAQQSIAEYIKNNNIRQSLTYNKRTGLYWYKHEWIDEKKLNEVSIVAELNCIYSILNN